MNFLGKCETQSFSFSGLFSLGVVGCRCRDTSTLPGTWEVRVKSQISIVLTAETGHVW